MSTALSSPFSTRLEDAYVAIRLVFLPALVLELSSLRQHVDMLEAVLAPETVRAMTGMLRTAISSCVVGVVIGGALLLVKMPRRTLERLTTLNRGPSCTAGFIIGILAFSVAQQAAAQGVPLSPHVIAVGLMGGLGAISVLDFLAATTTTLRASVLPGYLGRSLMEVGGATLIFGTDPWSLAAGTQVRGLWLPASATLFVLMLTVRLVLRALPAPLQQPGGTS